MKWFRKITKVSYEKEEPQNTGPKTIRVYVPSIGWGDLKEFDVLGKGYISFDKGGGQLVKNWDQFLKIVEIIETEDDDEKPS